MTRHPYQILVDRWIRSAIPFGETQSEEDIIIGLMKAFGEGREDFIEFYSITCGLNAGVYDDSLFSFYRIEDLRSLGSHVAFADKGIGISIFYARIGCRKIYRKSESIDFEFYEIASNLKDFVEIVLLDNI